MAGAIAATDGDVVVASLRLVADDVGGYSGAYLNWIGVLRDGDGPEMTHCVNCVARAWL